MFKKSPCAVCAEKERTIQFLKGLVQAPNTGPTLEQFEADAVLSGQQHIIDITPDKAEQLHEEISERDRVLSGTF